MRQYFLDINSGRNKVLEVNLAILVCVNGFEDTCNIVIAFSVIIHSSLQIILSDNAIIVLIKRLEDWDQSLDIFLTSHGTRDIRANCK